MDYTWSNLKDVVTLVSEFKTIIGGFVGGFAILSAAGLPRVGAGRALTLCWKSFFQATHPLSVRKPEIQKLTQSMQSLNGGRYIVVVGGKGIGKSRLIDTTLNHQHGVVKISVSCFSYFIIHSCRYS